MVPTSQQSIPKPPEPQQGPVLLSEPPNCTDVKLCEHADEIREHLLICSSVSSALPFHYIYEKLGTESAKHRSMHLHFR